MADALGEQGRGGAARGLCLAAARALLRIRLRQPGAGELGRDAWVVAPHPDDETLGCGGTILRKRELGARVRVVFLSDGAGSHGRFMPAEALSALRREEALAACAALGAEALFLGLPDGRLMQRLEEGTELLRELFGRERAPQVFTTFRGEPPADHRAAFEMARRALAGAAGARLLEYPVWAWRHWPWVPAEAGGRRGRLSEALAGLARCAAFVGTFRWRVPLGARREAKRRALAAHRSQVAAPPGRGEWPVLGEVSGGAFLKLFFQEFELFR